MLLRTLIFIALLTPMVAFAQASPEVSTFHRLLIFNASNQLLVVKIKDKDLWVTPGWYQDNSQSIKTGLKGLASSFGLTITEPELRGVFTLKMGAQQNTSVRLIYTASADNTHGAMPEGIDSMKWLPVTEALNVINLPHIRYQIKQIIEKPAIVWGGAQKMHFEDGTHHFEVIEDFYPLFTAVE